VLKKLICKFPSEFDRGTFEQRYGYHMNYEPFTRKPELWAKARRHLEAMTMTDLPTAYKKAMWHVHPVSFIEHMRKCSWISQSTLKRIYSSTPDELINTYRVALNQVTRKYGLNTAKRLPHFIGQGAVESDCLRSMVETAQELITQPDGSVKGGKIIADSKQSEAELGHWWGAWVGEYAAWYGSTKYNSKGGKVANSYNWMDGSGNLGDPDAQKFRGRGFKQLTHRANYTEYWLYRGWLDKNSFDANWWTDPEYLAKNARGMKKKPAEIQEPERLSSNPWNCMDTGGWFMVFTKIDTVKQMDKGDTDFTKLVRAVTKVINGGRTGFDERLKFTTIAKEILA
jgi:predicted chitinase